VAPNGNVYVADTWNHRIQYFDSSGTFLGKWGQLGDAKGSATDSPNVFWGPRAIAISPQGEVYVTDTGNKRVQVFGLDGGFLRMFGGTGSNPGQFNEPVGLALDSAGNVWVADAWNDRVQELDPQGKPLAQFTAPAGWTSQSVTNKPFLTVDAQGRIALTSPDAGQIVIYGTDGTQRSTIQLGSGSSAVGVTVAPDGRLVVADARGGSVVSEPAPTW
jgi:streptogramin lyase